MDVGNHTQVLCNDHFSSPRTVTSNMWLKSMSNQFPETQGPAKWTHNAIPWPLL